MLKRDVCTKFEDGIPGSMCTYRGGAGSFRGVYHNHNHNFVFSKSQTAGEFRTRDRSPIPCVTCTGDECSAVGPKEDNKCVIGKNSMRATYDCTPIGQSLDDGAVPRKMQCTAWLVYEKDSMYTYHSSTPMLPSTNNDANP